MFIISIFAGLLLTVISQQELSFPQNCLCEGGKCVKDKKESQYCKCSTEYIGRLCQLKANKLKLNNEGINSTIAEDFSIYYIQFDQVGSFYVQIAFCPIQFQKDTVFTINIDFVAPDGSLKQIQSEKQLHNFQPHQNECVAARYIIYPTVNEATGEIQKLTVRVKSNQNSSQKGISKNILSLSYRIFQFDSLQNKQLGQFLIISSLSSAILFCVTFAICKRLARRGQRRFVYHPAHIYQSIAHFDQIMPASIYLARPGEEKQCLICLLCVENTEVRITPCNHLFHKECLDQWGQKSQTCPTCRKSLKVQ